MRSANPIVICTAVILMAVSGHAQTTLSGNVVRIVDGKTFVLETANGRVTGTLQYVDVPEPEQPLSRLVREHLERLILGKTVSFTSKGFSSTALVGRAYLNGLDLGQQLVRDGAAWHVPAEQSGQDAEESRIYDGHQALARAEKRGVWSIANLRPAWEFRAIRVRSDRDIRFTKADGTSFSERERTNYKYQPNGDDMWGEVGGEALAQRNPLGQLFRGYDPDKKIRNISTPSIAQVLGNSEKSLEVEIRIVYFQGEIKPRASNTAFVIGVLATSTEHNFDRNNSLVFLADDKRTDVGTGQRFWRETPTSVQELIQYRISRGDLIKIAGANKLTVRIGNYTGTVGGVLRNTILELLEAAK